MLLGIPNMHVEIAKGDAEQNLAYITKDSGKPHYEHFSWGTPSKQGMRVDILELRNLIKQGKSLEELIRNGS